MLTRVLDVPLLAGWLPWAVAGLGLAGAAFLLAARSRRWWTRLVPAVLLGAAAVAATVAVLVDIVWRPFPDPLPLHVLAAVAISVAGVGLAVAGFGRRRWPGRAGSALAAALVVLAAAQGVNGFYGEYPTLRVALGLPAVNEVAFTDVAAGSPVVAAQPGGPLDAVWRAPAGMPAAGVVTRVDIPGTTSGFVARPARLYLPPAYLAAPRALLPVLVLLSGQPGGTDDWLDSGELATRMDAFAAAHGGLAPVVVMPDHLGSPLANPLCLDSRLGNAATYLRVDVPAWVRANLQVDPAVRAWAVGGLSNGGTCSWQMAVNAPEVYPTFVDVSGESEPSLGDRAATVQAAFGGDAAAFAAVNPLDVLAARTFPGTAGYLVGGRDDTVYLPQANAVLAACRGAGMDVELHVLPGGHTWKVWGPGLGGALPWLAARTGLTS